MCFLALLAKLRGVGPSTREQNTRTRGPGAKSLGQDLKVAGPGLGETAELFPFERPQQAGLHAFLVLAPQERRVTIREVLFVGW